MSSLSMEGVQPMAIIFRKKQSVKERAWDITAKVVKNFERCG